MNRLVKTMIMDMLVDMIEDIIINMMGYIMRKGMTRRNLNDNFVPIFCF